MVGRVRQGRERRWRRGEKRARCRPVSVRANAFPSSGHVLAAETWQSADTVALARALLGKVLVRTPAGGAPALAQVIVEVEAYDGERDLACDAHCGRTARNEVMYRAGGCWYVYLVYGLHELLNLVTGPTGYPAAILIRGLAGVNGPGRLTRAFGIDRSLNGAPATPAAGLHVEDRGIEVPARSIRRSPRIGVDYAGPIWGAKPWRFWFDPRRLDPAAVCPPARGSTPEVRRPDRAWARRRGDLRSAGGGRG
jgi:DNA-3-methyladenine glycosylase